MIIKLRNRLILTIMAFVSFIMLVAFAALYLVTYVRIYNENIEKVNGNETVNVSSEGQLVVGGQLYTDAVVVSRISPSIGVYFNLVVDETGDLLLIDSVLALTEADYLTAATIAMSNLDGGITELEGRKWQYTTGPGMYQTELDAEPQTNGLTVIRFLDITDSYKTLETLLATLIGLYVMLMAVFFILARYFANRSVRPMAEAWENQRQFIADASHELKTPISTLNANLDILYASQEDTIQEQLKWLDNSKKVLTRMMTLIQSMLELAKVDEQSEKHKIEAVLINDLLEESMDCYAPLAAKKKITITEDIDVNIPIYSNYNLIQQVVEILTDNAVKYTNENGEIRISAYIEKNEAVIKIQNTGNGISPADIDKVFDRFYRGDKARVYQKGSYGLGLSIAKSAVEKIGGDISVQSNSKQTVFTLKVPNQIPRNYSE